ncbi:hypothetical protein M9H77_19768 [Catharanthus roseus]|uniref:Uncharacterized protein n=1 Tax=Catharanthus roseus TaxID=4058 RepID=A0ACC0BB92_CATRO|nr:hypothetical protein M9H77_19768 [Catharanthus roseus]
MVRIDEEIIHEPLSPSSDIGEDVEIEDINYADLKKRMWKDRILMQKLKATHDVEATTSSQEPLFNNPQDMSRRKKMARAQDSILKYMVKIMEVCNAQGFVYGIVPEKGKTVTGSSDSLREWWKEKVRFDQNAPAALRKCIFVPQEREESLFVCQNFLCPESEIGFGFVDKNSRTQHEKTCAYGQNEAEYDVMDNSNFNMVSNGKQHQMENMNEANTVEVVQEVNRSLENFGSFWEDNFALDHHDDQFRFVTTTTGNMDLNLSENANSIWDLAYLDEEESS